MASGGEKWCGNMKKMYSFYSRLSKQSRDSLYMTIVLIGLASTILTIIGKSLNDYTHSIWISVGIVLLTGFVIFIVVYYIIGKIFDDKVTLSVRKTDVDVTVGNIFDASGWKVIGCDNHFDLRVDDIIISKKSLHGQLVLKHSSEEELRDAIRNAADRLNLECDEDGNYSFPLGTIVPYESSVDGEKYLLLSMTELNEKYEAHTNMAQYEQMLMRMWREIDRVYASNDIALPLLGAGISRFDDGPKGKNMLLKCMLCTLNSSGVSLKSKVNIVLYDDEKKYRLYEYKNMFDYVNRRLN